MLKKLLSLFVLILIIYSSTASNTVIKGNSKDFKGKEISVYTLTDYITANEQKVGFSKIQENGHFNFQFDAKSIKKVILKIEDKTTWFFIEPGKVYNINLFYDDKMNKGRVYDKQLSLKFNFPVPSELNQQIKKFNQKYDDFIEENTPLFNKRDRSIEPKMKIFKAEILKEFNTAVDFVKNYITYSLAITQNALDVSYNVYTSGKDSDATKAKIYLEYLDNQPVLYYNSEYMSFFKEFFKGEFKALTLSKVEGIEISNAINDNASYSILSATLGKYPFLINDEFKNLFLLNGLKEIYNDKYFTKENILKILTEIQTNSKYPEQKIIATNIIKKLTLKKLNTGSEAPSFKLKDINNKFVQLNEFKGKPIYINFWASWSIPALKEMKIMETLHKKYKGKIHFISICVDNDPLALEKFLKENPMYKWTFLNTEEDKYLTKKYNVRTFPTYFLIDKKGLIVKAPAGRPGGTAERATEDNIERDFYNLINEK